MSSEAGSQSTARSSPAHKWTVIGGIAVALVTVAGSIVVALISKNPGPPEVLPPPPASTTSSPAPSPLPSGPINQISILFGDSTADVRFVWPPNAAVRSSAKLHLEGAHATNSCSVKVRYEPKDAAGQLLEPVEGCADNPATWPKELGPAYFWAGAKIQQVDVIILVDGQAQVRATCVRNGGCRLHNTL